MEKMLELCIECDEEFDKSKLKECKSLPDCSNKICDMCWVSKSNTDPYICDDCIESTCQICLSRGPNIHDVDRLFICETCNLEVCIVCAAIVYCQSVYCYCHRCAKTFAFKCSNKGCNWSSMGSEYYSEYGVICSDSGENYCPDCNRGQVRFKTNK
jgi:hypothetical protein